IRPSNSKLSHILSIEASLILQNPIRFLAAFIFDLTSGQTWAAIIKWISWTRQECFILWPSLMASSTGTAISRVQLWPSCAMPFPSPSAPLLAPCTTLIVEVGRTGITAVHRLLLLNQSVLRTHFCQYATLGHGTRADPHRVVDDGEPQKYQLGICRLAFLTGALIPLTYPIAYSVIPDIVAYILINGSVLFIEKKASFGRITHDKSKRELWRTGLAGVGIVPIWIKNVAVKAQGKEYKHEEEDGADVSIGSFKQMENEKGGQGVAGRAFNTEKAEERFV
ncbi:hypothetical protein BC936DRAFT_140851, partial [Jimgerdemannia flammicorona]